MKKIISVLLAIVMAVSTLPFTVLSASAAEENGLVAEYLTGDLTTNGVNGGTNLTVQNGNGLTWDSTVGAAKFEGTSSVKPYLSVPFSSLLGETTWQEGFTVSFYGMTKDSSAISADTWQRYWELTSNEGFGNGDASTYLFHAPNGRIKTNLPNPNKHETGIIDYQGDTICNTNIWHHFVLTYSNASFILFVDGIQYGETITNESEYGSAWWNAMKQGNLLIGGSSYSTDPGFNGYIKRFRVFNKAVTPSLEDRAYSGMRSFEYTMDGTKFNGMSNAYKYYAELSATFDAFHYGHRDVTLDNLRAKLRLVNQYKNQMTVWGGFTRQTFDNDYIDYGSMSGDKVENFASGTGYSTYNKNVLRGEKNAAVKVSVTAKAKGGTEGNSNVQNSLMYPQMTLLYDGRKDILKTPVLVRFKASSRTNRYAYYASTEQPKLRFDSNVWYGNDVAWNWAWLYSNQMNNKRGLIGIDKTTTNVARFAYEGGFLSAGNYYNEEDTWANMFVLNEDFAEGEYLKEIVPIVKCVTGSDTTVKDTDIVATLQNNEAPIRYINYKALMDAGDKLNSLTVKNVTAYREGGLSDYFTKLDQCISSISSFDVTSFFTEKNGYQECADTIEAICVNVNQIDDLAANAKVDAYQSLRDAFEYSDTVAEQVYTGTVKVLGDDAIADDTYNPGFETESWKAFKTAYNTAVASMANVNEGGTNYNDSVGAAANAQSLKDAFLALEKSALFVDVPTIEAVGDYKAILTEGETVQIINNDFAESTKVTYTIKYEDGFTVSSTEYTEPIDVFGTHKASYADITATAKNSEINMSSTETARFYSIYAPTVTCQNVQEIEGKKIFGHNDKIIIAHNSAKMADSTLSYTLNGTETVAGSANDNRAEITPNADALISAKVTRTAIRETRVLSIPEVQYYYLVSPEFSETDGAKIAADTAVSINADGDVTVEYSYDGENWTEYTAPVVPFTDNSGKFVVTLYARVSNEASGLTRIDSIDLFRNESFDLYAVNDGQLDSFYYTETGTIRVSDTYKYSSEIYYMVTADGVADPQIYTYNTLYGIKGSDFADNGTVTITAFSKGTGEVTAKVAERTFVNKNHDDFVYHESFDGASIDGTTLKTGSKKGLNGTIAVSGASIVSGAGNKNSDGDSTDWRNNVLKLDQGSNSAITLAKNPLASFDNAPFAREKGVTISFWRHMTESTEPDNHTSNGIVNEANGGFTPSITFQSSNAAKEYACITATAYTCLSNGAVNGDNSKNDYVDIKPDNQDNTQHEVGNSSGYWVNVVVTIDPNKGIKIYTNGKEHNVNVTVGDSTGSYKGGDGAESARFLLNFLTKEDTNFAIANGVGYWGLNTDQFIDDIRLYTKPLKQVDIWNDIYNGEDADIKTSTSTSHDPTNVTVYTLASNGKQVGQEYIDYNQIDPTDKSVVSKIDYYSFGTGMTIYHSTDNEHWTCVGDSEGRFGYSNHDLFGAEYHTALATPLQYAAGDSRAGAGHLQWAPHVMYNLTLDTWVYYGSTSSWGSQTSAIFYCVSTDGTPLHYEYRGEIYHSTTHPNAIDACVFYEYDKTTNKPIPSSLKCIFGSWGGTNAIAAKNLYADGSATDITSHNGIICNGIDSNLEGASDDGSGEGGYVVYRNGYYYLYISFGQNTGSYVERVFRSTEPYGPYVDGDGTPATDTSTKTTHGNQLIGSFNSSLYDYLYVSTGHNSVYKVVNEMGEINEINALHARPLATEKHGFIALPDAALATRQSEVTGNVTLHNQIAYTESGWPVLMPNQYNSKDTVTENITVAELEGIYNADDMQLTEYYNSAAEYSFSILADTDTTAIMYGSRANGKTFNYDLKISEGADGTNYLTLYNGSEKIIEGVLGKHWDAEKGEYIVQFGVFNVNTTLQSWAYRVGDMPSVDQESAGDIISHSGVIYTHRADESYAKYGQRISDDAFYRTSQEHQGERCTTITTSYPYIIDTSNAGSITGMRNEEFARAGYTGSDIRARDVYDSWVDEDGNVLTDAQAKENAANGLTVKRVYCLYGYVSNYFHYHEDGDSVDSGNTSELTQRLKKNHYTESGVQLVIRYQNKDTGESYGEYEFFYVEPNPANAHSIVAIRDQDQNMHGAASMFTGFDSSYGNVVTAEGSNSAGKYLSKLTNNGNNNINDNDHRSAGITSTDENGNKAISYGIGVFNHLGDWGSAGSFTNDPDGSKGYTTGGDNSGYNEPARIRDSFNFFDQNLGVNSGAYSLVEYYGMGRNSDGYSVAAADLASYVVDADYYIDYSNQELYDFDRNGDNLITVDTQGKPTGYKLNFFVNNINWNPKNEKNVKAGTNYCRNNTGLPARATIVKNSNDHLVGNTSIYHTTKTASGQHNGNDNKYALSWNSEQYGRRVMSSDYKLSSSDNGWINGLWSPFSSIDNGFNNTGDWRGEIYLTGTGFQNISKKHDNNDVTSTTYAEDNSNFVFEKGVNYHLNSVGVDYYAIQQAYSYYNVGVSTCDKGAVREFVETYCNKQMNITRDANGKITSIRPVYDNNGNPKDIVSSEYSVTSYQEYLDALAEAYWFIEDSKNTTYSSYVDADGNTVNCDETNYSTAYGVTPDGKEHALIYADDVADDIFGNSGVSTDPVQAKLIADVIEAYGNLFTQKDYENAEQQYNDAKQAIANLLADAEGNYTSTSKDAWDNFANGINDYFTYYLNRDEPVENQEYWRYVELTGSEYRELEEAIQVMKTTLMPVIESEPLAATISSKKQDLTNGIGTKSFASWEALYNEAVSAQELIAQKDVEDEHGFLPGKYAVTGTGSYTYGGKEYKYQTFDANDDSLSTLQTNINSENDVLAAKELEGIDETEAYQAYDSIYAVMQNVDWNKYDPQYVDEIKATLADTYDEVYTKLTVEQAQTVNDFFGTTVVNADQAYGRTALQKTDPITATLMTYNTVVNDEQKSKYVKQFDAVFTSTTTDSSGNEITSTPTVQSKYYGEAFTFTEPTLNQGQYVKWTLTNYDYSVDVTGDLTGVAPNGSTKVKTTASTFDRIADANIVVQAKVLGGSTENTIPVYIYNAYGRVVEIKYVTDSNYQASDDATVKAEKIPFYNFSVWKNYQQKDSEGNVTSIHIYPSYTPAEICNLSTTGGTISNTTADFNTKITLDGSSVENFYAWASEVNGTYSVASYNPVYEFYAYGSESFTPITKDETNGYMIGGQPLDPETFVVDTTFNYGDYKTDYTNLDSAKMTKLDFIESKLDNKYPFIQIISKSNHVDENGITKYYAYCRITDGAVNRTGCTITMNNGTSEFTGNVTKILSNGQFYVSTKSNVSFKANISYDYNLAFNGSNTDNNAQTTLISVTDSSATV